MLSFLTAFAFHSQPRRNNTTGASQPQLIGYNCKQRMVAVITCVCSAYLQLSATNVYSGAIYLSYSLLCEPSGTISRRSLGGRLRAWVGRLQTRVACRIAAIVAVSISAEASMCICWRSVRTIVVMDITRFGDRKMRLMVFALIFTTFGKCCRQL